MIRNYEDDMAVRLPLLSGNDTHDSIALISLKILL